MNQTEQLQNELDQLKKKETEEVKKKKTSTLVSVSSQPAQAQALVVNLEAVEVVALDGGPQLACFAFGEHPCHLIDR